MIAMKREHMGAAIERIRPAVDKIIERSREPDAPIVHLRDELVSLFKGAGLITRQQINSVVVVVHTRFSFGDGCWCKL